MRLPVTYRPRERLKLNESCDFGSSREKSSLRLTLRFASLDSHSQGFRVELLDCAHGRQCQSGRPQTRPIRDPGSAGALCTVPRVIGAAGSLLGSRKSEKLVIEPPASEVQTRKIIAA